MNNIKHKEQTLTKEWAFTSLNIKTNTINKFWNPRIFANMWDAEKIQRFDSPKPSCNFLNSQRAHPVACFFKKTSHPKPTRKYKKNVSHSKHNWKATKSKSKFFCSTAPKNLNTVTLPCFLFEKVSDHKIAIKWAQTSSFRTISAWTRRVIKAKLIRVWMDFTKK